jgi:HD-GYP domain-containing protein (c-di-GMP phosphodiesterase class II)
MEGILLGAKDLSDADGGTLYLMTEDEDHLKFMVVQTDSLKIKMGGTEGDITWPELLLTKEDGTKNRTQVAALCAIDDKLINIPDVYEAEDFDFSGTKKFDEGTGYRTKSMLVIPMKNHENTVIGVIQLLNKQDSNGDTIDFTKVDEELIISMSSQAAVSITNTRLIVGLEELLDSFIQSIAGAIGEKSKYTGGHIDRVAKISTMIAKAINEDDKLYKDYHFDEDQIKEINTAAWLHDIGKIVTPEYVVDKSNKLETIYDRVHTVIATFEVAKRDIEIEYLRAKAKAKNKKKEKELKKKFKKDLKNIEDDLEFIKSSNVGGEFMTDDKLERITSIGKRKITIDNQEKDILSENEIYNLSIRKGTLTNEERSIINNHVMVTYNMLSKLPFPKKLSKVPLMAASHHKAVKTDENGKHGGYGSEEIMSIPMTVEDKILAVADVFEALTASDRPYKKANTLNQSMRILSFMVKDNDLDRDLVKFFVEKGLHTKYAKENLLESQMDEITIDFDNI